jgi:hypothetical protein
VASRPAGTPIEPGVVARVANGIRWLMNGNDFFGPGQPIGAAAQQQVEGRGWDYPIGYNIQQQPRAGEPISFQQLRGLADGHDLLRLAIETRKDQMAKLEYTIKPKGGKGEPDTRCKKIQTFLERPDVEHDWDDWLRMWLEEVFVTDAPAIYPRKTKGGELYALEHIDGATIKRILNVDGRTPVPPDPAYAQVIKGITAANYTLDELFYLPRNGRVSRIYGYSPVEQIIMTVNIALRRQAHQLNYYTEGNIPPMLVGVPATWTAPQIEQFQKVWDAMMSGDQAKLQKLKFVPGGMDITELQKEEIFGAADEWLARVICYAMNLPPNAFVKQQNRATAGSAQEIALEEGLAPIMRYVARKMSDMIGKCFNAPDLEFAWEDQTDIDPMAQAQIDKIYADAGIDTPDEIREARGMPPLPDGAGAKPKVPITPITDPGADGAGGDGKPGQTPPQKKGNPDGVTAAAAEKFASLVDHGVTPNAALKLVGIDHEIEGGDVPLVNAALVPLSAALELGKRESKTIHEG